MVSAEGRRSGPHAGFIGADEIELLIDHYELTMLQAYHAERRFETAVFSLFVRRLPKHRNYLLACGLETVLALLEAFRFSASALDHLRRSGTFDPDFIDWLAELRFTGDVWALPEGTPIFADEPILEIEAPLPEAQVLETLVMNQIHLQTVLASKAARVRAAAGDRSVVDFGIRRMHGTDAALKSARAFHVAGLDATSNVLAGKVWGVPVTGTMAHSYIQSHDHEIEAFRDFMRSFPETILLVDTYDTLAGVHAVVALAKELGDDFRAHGIRLDSGDLSALAKASRKILDEAGLARVRIFASGGLDEWAIRALLDDGAPIDGFGVGTGMGVARDAPALDIAYKLTSYAGRGRLKLSEGKGTLPGRKQVFRRYDEAGRMVGDTIAAAGEELDGEPLLGKVMEGGSVIAADGLSLEAARARAAEALDRMPDRLRALDDADPPYPIAVSPALERYGEEVAERVAEQWRGGGMSGVQATTEGS